MQIKIWGTRGSIPVSGSQFERYGGETSCIEVKTDSGETIILDAGSGIASYDRSEKEPGKTPVICLSHAHLDHIQGLPFYSPIYSEKVKLYGPKGMNEHIDHLFDGVFHPVKRDQLKGLEVIELESGDRFKIGDAEIEVKSSNHPGVCLAYKITADGTTFVYSGDHEIDLENDSSPDTADLINFIAGSDIVLVDSHFSREDHALHPGWGHSHPEQWVKALKSKNVGKIYFGHFSPSYTDDKIDDLIQEVQSANPEMELAPAYGGCIIRKDEKATDQNYPECEICSFFQKTASLSDTHAVLDALLTEARKLCQAEAGSVYLIENDELVFSAAQNDILFPNSTASKFFYMNSRIPINKSSIAGYTAATGQSLNIPDVYFIKPDIEYKFNKDFDKQSNYRTKSVLTVPLLNAKGKTAGVVQLINSRKNDKSVPFTLGMQRIISRLASMATVPIERSFMITNMILRMLKTSALRDPSETAGHVYRVGSIAAELYHHWAEKRGIDPEEILAKKGMLRLAAMLHDVGKVGIPDAVLKKPGKLDDDEFKIMKKHTSLGASLFLDGDDGIDKIARDIVLHHHAKWNGEGYTGDENMASPKGEDIPIYARITAIADVYDALVSRRCYKTPMPSEEALKILKKDAGTHFDPELVNDFIEIKDIVDTIIERYK